MDRSLTLLLLAIALTWLAWRAARRQTQRAILMRSAEQERNSCTLVPVETAQGRGFVVIAADGTRSDEAALRWTVHGVEIVAVEPLGESDGARVAPGFNAGSDVELIRADGDASLEVWDPDMTLRAGILDRRVAGEVMRRAEAGEVGECIVVWEHMSARRRTGLRVLLVHADMLLEQQPES